MFTQEEDKTSTGISLRRRLLGSVAVTLYRHPLLSFFFLAALTVLSGSAAVRLDVEMSLRVFVEPQAHERIIWEQMGMISPPHTPVTAVVKMATPLDPDTRNQLEQLFADAWRDPAFVTSVTRIPYEDPIPPLSYEDILARLRPEDLGLLEQMAASPESIRDALTGIWNIQPEGWGRLSETALSRRSGDPFRLFETLRARGDSVPGPFPASLPPTSYIESSDRRMVFVIHPVRAPGDFFFCRRLKRFLERSAESLILNPPAEIRETVLDFGDMKAKMYGRHIDTALTAFKFRIDMVRSVSILALCTFLLLILSFRKFESFIFVLLPPCFALVWTYGATSLFTQELSLIAAVFPFLLTILGVEFVTQMYHRFTEELYRTGRFYPALRTAYAETGQGIIVSTIVMTIIFFSLQFSSFRPLREIALVGALGTISMALAALLLLPPFAAIKSRLAGNRVMPLDTWDFALRDISAAVISAPRATLAIGLLVTAYLAYHARQASFDESAGLDMGAPQALTHRAVDPESPNLHLADVPISILLEAPSKQEALGLNDRLYANLLKASSAWKIGGIRSLSPALPSETVQNAVRMQLDSLRLDDLTRSLQVAAPMLRMEPDFFEPFTTRLRELRDSSKTAPLLNLRSSMDDALLEVTQKHLLENPEGGGYRILTTVFLENESPLVSGTDFEIFCNEAMRGLPADAPRWFQSEYQQNLQVAQTVIFSMALTVLLSLVSVVICLFPHFRWRLRDVLLAMVPLTCAIVWTLGFLSILNKDIGLYALLALPLVTGYAVNQATLFIQRLHERQYATLRQVMRAGGRPGVISGIMLGIGLACLTFVRFPPMHEMAVASVIAVSFSTLSTLVLIPAILQVRQEGGLTGWGVETEE